MRRRIAPSSIAGRRWMDTTLSNLNNKTINGTDDDDNVFLTGTGDGNTVNALSGSDNVRVPAGSSYTNTVVNGLDGNDSFSGFGSGSTLYGNKGYDTIIFDNPVNGASAFGGQDDDRLGVGLGGPAGPFPGGDEGGNGDDEGPFPGNDREIPALLLRANAVRIDAVDEGGIGSQGDNVFLSGDAGNDTIFDSSSSSGTTMLGGQDNDSIFVNGTNDNVNGNSGNDTIVVAGSNNMVLGGQNQDNLSLDVPFGSGSDTVGAGNILNGNKGNDTLNDNGFAGSLSGGQDNDTLTGRNAQTTLVGGLGSDLFVVDNRGQAESGFDGGFTTISDFVTGTDKVQLGNGDAPTTATYREAKVNGNRAAAITAATDGGYTGYTFVAGDNNGFLIHTLGGTVDSAVKLTGANSLDSFAITDIQANAVMPK